MFLEHVKGQISTRKAGVFQGAQAHGLPTFYFFDAWDCSYFVKNSFRDDELCQ
jgi:hypothetical protein